MKMPNEHKLIFPKLLLKWNKEENDRKMPWKGEKDAYKIWLSEIILQQTRVLQGLKYYENFISTYPDVHALARAPEDHVFKLWEGLGYYSRCRNLIVTAKFISSELGGKFPTDYESIIKLKGIGNYTAAAISSFAFNLPYAVVDGNVLRVLSRITGNALPVDSNEGKKFFAALAMDLLPLKRAGEYNQAIMDFGAVICKPKPECQVCFYTSQCNAYLTSRQQQLPVKEKKLSVKKRYLHYFFSVCGNYTAIGQRTAKDIWQQLYEFPIIETETRVTEEKAQELFRMKYKVKNAEFVYTSQAVKQKLTHQELCFNFHKVDFNKKEKIRGFNWVPLQDISLYPFPKTIASFLKEELF